MSAPKAAARTTASSSSLSASASVKPTPKNLSTTAFSKAKAPAPTSALTAPMSAPSAGKPLLMEISFIAQKAAENKSAIEQKLIAFFDGDQNSAAGFKSKVRLFKEQLNTLMKCIDHLGPTKIAYLDPDNVRIKFNATQGEIELLLMHKGKKVISFTLGSI